MLAIKFVSSLKSDYVILERRKIFILVIYIYIYISNRNKTLQLLLIFHVGNSVYLCLG